MSRHPADTIKNNKIVTTIDTENTQKPKQNIAIGNHKSVVVSIHVASHTPVSFRMTNIAVSTEAKTI